MDFFWPESSSTTSRLNKTELNFNESPCDSEIDLLFVHASYGSFEVLVLSDFNNLHRNPTNTRVSVINKSEMTPNCSIEERVIHVTQSYHCITLNRIP